MLTGVDRFPMNAGALRALIVAAAFVSGCGGGGGGDVGLVALPDLFPPSCDPASWTTLAGPDLANTTTAEVQDHPQIAALSGGGVVAVWASDQQDGDKYGVYARIYDAAGNPVTGEIAVNTYVVDLQWFPAVAGLPDGGFVVSWTSGSFSWEGKMTPDGDGTSVSARIFNVDGSPRTDEFQVNDSIAHDQRNSSVLSLSDGSFVCIYRSGRELVPGQQSFGERGFVAFKRYDPKGVQLVGETIVADLETIGEIRLEAEPDHPTGAALANGRFVISWNFHRLHGPDPTLVQPPYPQIVRARIFNADGRAHTGILEVSQQPTDIDTWEFRPRAAAAPGGGFAVSWMSQRPSGQAVLVRHFDPNGLARGDEQAVVPVGARDPRVVLTHGLFSIPDFGFVVAAYWDDARAGEVVAQAIDAEGASFGPPWKLPVDASLLVNPDRGMSGVMLPSGTAVMAFTAKAPTSADRDDVHLVWVGCR